jgi:SAM-dependent methyltransferase
MSFQDRHVKDVYNEIAPHFSVTRAYTWDGIYEFVNNLDNNSNLLEIGCGNGKNLLIRDDIFTTGIDISESMATICSDKSLEVMVGDCLNLPFRNNIFTATISVAVIHHLDTFKKRQLALREQIRVTAPGGLIFIQVWGDTVMKPVDKFIPVKNSSDNDYLVRWQKHDGTKYYRYYHLFNKIEFMEMINLQNNIKIVRTFHECHNWVAILKVI